MRVECGEWSVELFTRVHSSLGQPPGQPLFFLIYAIYTYIYYNYLELEKSCPLVHKSTVNRSVKPFVSRTTCGQPRGQVDNLRDKSEEQSSFFSVCNACLRCFLWTTYGTSRSIIGTTSWTSGQPIGQVGITVLFEISLQNLWSLFFSLLRSLN